jgi:hypothetical protein
MDYPLEKGESWWVVHPNIGTASFRIPTGAITVCILDFLDVFKQGVVYSIVSADPHNGWITIASENVLYDMPEYIFSRYFDAEAFVIGIATPEELEKAKLFNYKSTIPKKPKIENFKG